MYTYHLTDDNGSSIVQLETLQIKGFFLHEFGLYKIKNQFETDIICERIIGHQFYLFYNEIKEKFDIKITKNFFLKVDSRNAPFDYHKYYFKETMKNQKIYEIFLKYKSLKNILNFEFLNCETLLISYNE